MSKSKRQRKTSKRIRMAAKQQLRAATIAPPAVVHICGTRPQSDGLTRLQRELIADAERIQHCRAGTPIEATSITEQHSWGWTVYHYRGEDDTPAPVVGLTGHVDELVTQDRYARRLAKEKVASASSTMTNIARLQQLRKNAAENNLRDAIISEVY